MLRIYPTVLKQLADLIDHFGFRSDLALSPTAWSPSSVPLPTNLLRALLCVRQCLPVVCEFQSQET